MTAKGKINAANLQINDRIIVKVYSRENGTDQATLDFIGADYGVGPSDTKTGQGVQVVRVISKSYAIVAGGGFHRRDRRVYLIETSVGKFEASPIQTMILAPEDAAGIKRARAEAELEDAERAATPAPVEFTEQERAELAEDFQTSGALDEAHEEALALNPSQVVIGSASAETPGTVAYSQDREDDEDGMHPECEAKGCDLPEGALECRRCGAEPLVIEDEDLTLHSQDGKVDNMNNASDTETTPAPPTTENHTGSAVVSLLEKVWARIRADHPELPEVVIITGSGLVGASKWGHFRAEGWKVKEEGAAVRKHELFLAGEALAKGARQVLQTMLHEAAHTLAKVRGQQDTSRQGRWHNATFRKMAEELGLEHRSTTADKTNGFSFVTLTAATAERYTDLLAELDREIRLVCHLPLWMGGTADQDEETEGGEKITGKPQGEGGTKSGPLKATCGCEEPLIIRLSQKVMDLGVVRCDKCEELFTAG